MTEIAQQYIVPAAIGGAVVIIGKTLDMLNVYFSKKSGKSIDKKTLYAAIREVKEEISKEMEASFTAFYEKRDPCAKVIDLENNHETLVKQFSEIKEEIRKNGEITSNSLVFLIREREYRLSYLAKKRENKKYFKDGTPVFRFSIVQTEAIESIAFQVSEDYLNTKIVDSEDIILMNNYILTKIQDLLRIGKDIFGKSVFEEYYLNYVEVFKAYSVELEKIFIDKENDKVQRVHTLSLRFVDEAITNLRDCYVLQLTGGTNE